METTMICRLCLKFAHEIIDIFDAAGSALNIASILCKYFWFEPKNDDPISTVICCSCWAKVCDFHEFYLLVEEAHRLLSERFSFNNIRSSNLVAVEQTTTDIEPLRKKVDLATIEEASDTLHNEALEVKDFKMDTSNNEEISIDNEDFLRNTSSLDPVIVDDETNSSLIKSESSEVIKTRRVTRSSAGKKTSVKETFEKQTHIKRRGRPPKDKNATKSELQKKSLSNLSYTKKMREIDDKIARHMKLRCDICEIVLDTFFNLRKHMSKSHGTAGYAVCCNKKFHKRHFLTDHIERHNNPNKFKCGECDKTFSDKQCLRNHELLKHQPEKDMIHQCEHCPRKFSRNYLLEQHRVTHEERNLPCNECDRRFPNASLLGTHIKMVHSNYGATMCDICAKVIRGRAAFEQHQKEHEGVTTPKVQCKICGSMYKNKYLLQRHMLRHNVQQKQHICNFCGKIAPNRDALLSHKRYVHTGERKYKCSVCEKAFKKPVELKEHMSLHTGEVLYSCPHCTRTFNSNANMHSHRKKMHPKEWENMRKARNDNITKENTQPTTEADTEEFSSEIITINKDGTTNSIIVASTDFNEQNVQADLNSAESIVFTLS